MTGYTSDTYCETCKRATKSVFNDFMVEFCVYCKAMKGYYVQNVPYTCLECGNSYEESYIGQTMCDDCFLGLSNTDNDDAAPF